MRRADDLVPLELLAVERFPAAVGIEVERVEVLEKIGTPEARQVLELLARKGAGDRLAREARASLLRLDRLSAAHKLAEKAQKENR